MNNDKGSIPLFATVVSVLMLAVGLFFAFGFFSNPASVLKEVDTGNPAIQRLAFTLGTRSLSMALALLLALVLRSRWALITVLSMRAVTEVLDLVNILSGPHEAAVLVVVTAMIVLELIAIALLWRSLRTDRLGAR